LRNRHVDNCLPQDALRRLSAVSYGDPRHAYAVFGILCERRSASSCQQRVTLRPELRLCDRYRPDARRLFARTVFYGVLRLVLASFGISCRRRNPRRWFSRIVFHGVPCLVRLFGIPCRRPDVRSRDARRRLAEIMFLASEGSVSLH
jgi:hypothetical protein